MEANRTVFKISGSIGPGGAFVILAEKLCRAIWYEAYEQDDPKKAPSERYQAIAKKQRGDFVSELFQVRSRLEREIDSLNDSTRQKAYDELIRIIQRHARIIARTEKQRLQQERNWYKSDPLKYQQSLDATKLVDGDTIDNLTKMAVHIVKGADLKLLAQNLDQLEETDIETGNIEDRVTERRANELLIEWKKLLVKAEQEEAGAGQSQKLIVTLDQRKIDELKSRLFQITGEDTLDTFKAFEHYGFNQELTAMDRYKYQK